ATRGRSTSRARRTSSRAAGSGTASASSRGTGTAHRRRVVRTDVELLDLADLVVHDLQAQRERGQRAVGLRLAAEAHRADEGDLLCLDVRHVELVLALAGHVVPQALMAEGQADAVLGEDHVVREQVVGNLVRLHGVQVLVDEAFEAGTVARTWFGLRVG